MSNYVLTLSDKVDCANSVILPLTIVLAIISFACFFSFIMVSDYDDAADIVPIVITGVIFICSLIFSIAYWKICQVQTYTVNESILNDNKAKTELLKDYYVVKYSDTPDGQICLIKIEDAERWN
jgi:hypothetical protein